MKTINKKALFVSSVFAASCLLSGTVAPIAVAAVPAPQTMQANSEVRTIPSGTLVRVVLQRALDSTTMEVGDKVRVQIAPDDVSGLPHDCVLVGRVTEVAPATKTAPGIIDAHFGALERAGGSWKSVSLDLAIGTQSPVDQTAGQTASVSLVGQTQQNPNTKLIGYGAGAGAVLGSLFQHRVTGRSLIRGSIVGALTGGAIAQTQKGPDKGGSTSYKDVKLPAGTEMTVVLNQAITVESTLVVGNGDGSKGVSAGNSISLIGDYLQPTELIDIPVDSQPGTRKLYLRFTGDGKLQGFGGLNTFTGPYKLGTNQSLVLGPFAVGSETKPAASKDLEMRYLNVLNLATSYRFDGADGQTLVFLNKDRVIARFKKMQAP